jgi:surface polysaccharide O-acyltransferase-like enzyme
MNRQYGALSGAAIFLIVLNHSIHFGLQAAPVQGAVFQALVVLQALGAFAVPAFLFVSGAFLAYAARELSAAFVRNSLERILWPYVIWSLIFYAVVAVGAGERYSAAGYVKNLLVGYPYHFVPLLVFWYLATPLLVKVGRTHGTVLIVAIAAWQAWLMVLHYPEMFGLAGRLPAWARATAPPVIFTSMADWGVFFPLGLVMSLDAAALKPRLERWRWAMVAATLVLFGIGLANAFRLVNAPWARLVAPVPLMFVMPVIDRAWIPRFAWFEWLGRRSYGIYLSHFVAINLMVIALGRWIPLPAVSAFVVYPLFLVIALGFPLLLMEAAARSAAGRRAYRFVFGIPPPAPARPVAPIPRRS